MQYLIRALDGEHMLDRRMEVRQTHLENLSSVRGTILCAGGLLDEEKKLKGSSLIIDFEDEAALEEYMNSEPYVRAGVWQDIEVHPINVLIVNGEKVQ